MDRARFGDLHGNVTSNGLKAKAFKRPEAWVKGSGERCALQSFLQDNC